MENFEKLLKEHYADRQLPEPRVQEILESCSEARTFHSWKRIAVGAVAVATVSLTTLGLQTISHLRATRAGRLGTLATQEVSRETPQEALHHLQLVAVRIHADGCSRSQQLAPLFADLQAEFIDEPVLFLTFDYSSEPTLHQTECLSRILGMGDIFERYRKTGSIIVADCNGVVRDVVDTGCELAMATEMVRHNLH